MDILLHFIISFFATISFAILFHVPREQYVFCGLTGAIGWLCYRLVLGIPASTVAASLVSTMVLAGISRVFAVRRKTPITVFLLCGIFPLVPGAGIYYTAYYFIMNDNDMAVRNGVETIKCAVAIALGIVLVLSIPYSWLRKRRRSTT